MRVDELMARNLGLLGGLYTASYERWKKGIKDAIAGDDFKAKHLFELSRQQFADNWNTWIAMMAVTDVLPTLYLQGAANDLGGLKAAVLVQQRLTDLGDGDFTKTALEPFGGGQPIPADSYVVDPTQGDFDRKLGITTNVGLTADAAGIYRGLLLVQVAGGVAPEPVAWVVIVAS
ncbi:MAG: hypothetical protein QNK04_18350 [Myxococcota bacterium]|nr:hypothetical protein [Myxococcota bacterium]